MRVSGFIEESIVDGEGVRFVIFAQGCRHHCKGCHNPATWSFSTGTEMTVDEVLAKIDDDPLRQGVTFSGGDPFEQAEEFAELAKKLRSRGYDIWCYTGYTLEHLMGDENFKQLLSEVDVLVDGPFEIDNRDISLPFRGSSNQRIIRLREAP